MKARVVLLAAIALLVASGSEAARLVFANQSTAANRRVYCQLVDVTDGMTPETGESGGQPQVSTNGAAWTDTGIGTLTHIGNGRYYADLTQTLVATAETWISVRYKSANTAEAVCTSVHVVGFDPSLSPLMPTVAGRTLDVSATGGAGLDWSNVESQTSTVALTNTTIGTVTSVTSVSSVSGETSIVSPVGTGGLLTLTRCDDYYEADDTELSFTRDTWPSLASATSVTLTVRARSDDTVVFAVTDKVASRVTGAGDQTVVFEVGTANTCTLTPGRLTGKYDVQAVLSNGHIVTLEVTDPPNSYGGVTVLEDQTR
jgi:hypothetical protein